MGRAVSEDDLLANDSGSEAEHDAWDEGAACSDALADSKEHMLARGDITSQHCSRSGIAQQRQDILPVQGPSDDTPAGSDNADKRPGAGDLQHNNSVEDEQQIISRIALNPHKAGMTGVDQAYVNKIIYEASKDSLYFKNEQKKDRQVQERVVWGVCHVWLWDICIRTFSGRRQKVKKKKKKILRVKCGKG